MRGGAARNFNDRATFFEAEQASVRFTPENVRFTPESGHWSAPLAIKSEGGVTVIRAQGDTTGTRECATVLPENSHRQDRGAARQPITAASMVLALPTLRHAPSDHWQAYGIT
jgi:hypothetical protein